MPTNNPTQPEVTSPYQRGCNNQATQPDTNHVDKILWNAITQAVTASINAPDGVIDTVDKSQQYFDEAKAQLRNYISEEIKTVIGQLETTMPEPNYKHWTYTPEAIERDNLRNNQLTEAKHRGHNV